jgi:hypothetical protein
MVAVHTGEVTMVQLGKGRRILACCMRQAFIIGGKELDQR